MPITKEQIESIPERIKTTTAYTLAKEFNCHPRTIYLWISKLRASGIEVITKRGVRPVLANINKQ